MSGNGTSRNGKPSLTEVREHVKLARAKRQLARLEAEFQLYESFGLNWLGGGVDPFWAPDANGSVSYPVVPFGRDARRDGQNSPHVWTEEQLDQMRTLARWLADKNGFAIGILSNLTNYSIKTGFTWEAKPRVPCEGDSTATVLARQVQACLDEFSDLNSLPQRERSAFRRSRRDGDVAVRFFAQPDGTTLVRFVEAEQIRQPPGTPDHYRFGIVTDPRDIETVLGYCVWYTPNDWEFVKAEEMAFLKLNVDECVKRGLSDFFATADSLDRVSKLVRNMEVAGGIQAAIAWFEQFEGATASGVAAAVSTARDQARSNTTDPLTGKVPNLTRYDAGSVVKFGKGRTVLPPPVPVGASVHIQIEQASLRAIGSRWSMPEFFTGDASNNNYASILVSGSPFVTAVECEQVTVYQPYFAKWQWTAVRIAAAAGRFAVNGHIFTADEVQQLIDIHGTPPTVAIANKLEEAQIDEIDLRNEVISKQHRRAKLGVDDAKMRQEIAADPIPSQQPLPAAPPGGPGGFFPRLARPAAGAGG